MPSRKQIGDSFEKEVAELIEKELRLLYWRKAPAQRFHTGEIFGIADGIAFDGSDFILVQAKFDRNHNLAPVAKKFCKEAQIIFGRQPTVPLIWFFFGNETKIQHCILEENYTLSIMGEYERNAKRTRA